MIPKGVEKDSMTAAKTAQGNAANAFATVSPIYQDDITHPTGYTPQEIADMKTSIGQTAGGGVAATTGQAALSAARTGNIGGYQVATDDAARAAQARQMDANLGVDVNSAELAQRKRAAALAGESAIYSDSNSTGLGYEKNALDAANSNPWMKILLQSMQSAGQVGAAAA